MRGFAFLCLWLLSSLLAKAQNPKTAPDPSLYITAEKWFHAENTNSTNDSLAYSYYQRMAEALYNHQTYNEILVDCFLKSGILKMSDNQYQAALQHFNKAIQCFSKAKRLPDSLLFQPYLYAGSVHYTLNQLDSALYFYKKAEDISSHYTSLNESERLYNKLGALYYETGELQKSIPYFEKALSLVSAKKAANGNFFVVNYKNNIATALLKMGKLQQALDMYKELLGYHINTDALYSNIGTIYYEQDNTEESLRYFRLVKQNSIEKYNHLTMVFLKRGNIDSAGYYNKKANDDWAKDKTGHAIDYILLHKYRGDIFTMQQNYTEAARCYQTALTLLVPGFTSQQIAESPVKFSGLPNFSLLFDVLMAKAHALQKDNVAAHQPFALNAVTAALDLAHYVERVYASDEARLFLKNKINTACKEAVNLALALYQQKKEERFIAAAFGYVENTKASVLQAGLQQLALVGIKGLPVDLLAAERNYKAVIARLSINLSHATDSISKISLQQKMRDAELALAALQEKLDENPVYHQLKFNTETKSWEKIKKQLALDMNRAMLSYYYTGNELICFYISATQSGYTSIPLNETFFGRVSSLRKELESPEGSSRKELNKLSTALYQVLLQPVIEKIKNQQHLVIIPYNEISYLPFELLEDASGRSMLQRFAISYLYSANFLSVEKKPFITHYNVLALAPFSDASNDNLILPALPASAREVANLPGDIITGAQATKNNFLQHSGQYPIIHLATHAVASDTSLLDSYIAFYGKANEPDSLHRLYEKEIYNLDMQQARLIILSACETGSGMLVNGEGIVSLSRAFAYAGCKSVVTSLWKAQDASTAYIMKQLHYYLQHGYATDAALQQAKLDFLNNTDISDRDKTPGYWAHMILIGDAGAIVEAKSYKYQIVITVLLVLLAAIFIIYRIKKRAA